MKILITGANRGIGLALCQHYLSRGYNVIACCRDISNFPSEVQSENLQVTQLDVASEENILSLPERMAEQPIDVVINNAGVFGGEHQELDDISVEQFLPTFCINSIAPILVTRALLPLISCSERKLVVNISSIMGSIEENNSSGYYVYRASKSALNAMTKNLAQDLLSQEITVVALHPGWVKTRMGGEEALFPPESSATNIAKLIDDLSLDSSGKFLNFDGKVLEW